MEDALRLTVFYIEYFLLLTQFLLCCFPDKAVLKARDDEQVDVYDTSNEKIPLLTSQSLKDSDGAQVVSSSKGVGK